MLKKFHTGEGVMSTPLPTCVHKLPAVQPRGLKTGLAKNAGLHGLMWLCLRQGLPGQATGGGAWGTP